MPPSLRVACAHVRCPTTSVISPFGQAKKKSSAPYFNHFNMNHTVQNIKWKSFFIKVISSKNEKQVFIDLFKKSHIQWLIFSWTLLLFINLINLIKLICPVKLQNCRYYIYIQSADCCYSLLFQSLINCVPITLNSH